MPIKDPAKNREYQRLWAQKKMADPIKHAHRLEVRKQWYEKNKEKLRANNNYKTTKTKKESDEKYCKTEKCKIARKKYYLAHKEKLLNREKLFKSKIRYGSYWEAHRALLEVGRLLKGEQNGSHKK